MDNKQDTAQDVPPSLPFGTVLMLLLVGGAGVIFGGLGLLFMLFFFWPAFFS